MLQEEHWSVWLPLRGGAAEGGGVRTVRLITCHNSLCLPLLPSLLVYIY